jgi:hypothetical protein
MSTTVLGLLAIIIVLVGLVVVLADRARPDAAAASARGFLGIAAGGAIAVATAYVVFSALARPGDTKLMVVLYVLLGGFGALAAAHRAKDRNFVLPHRIKETEGDARPIYDAGFIGDFAVGMAGAIAIVLIVPGNLAFTPSPVTEFLRTLALGLVGGYGARAVLDAALKARLDQAERAAEEAKREAESLAERRRRASAAKLALQSHLEGTAPQTQEAFEALFRTLPSDGPNDLFQIADQFRSRMRRDGRRGEIPKALPALLAIEAVAPRDSVSPAELHASIAMVYFDQAQPDFEKALARIGQAIEAAQRKPAKYLIIQAVSLTMLALRQGASPEAKEKAKAALVELHAAGGWIENAEYRARVNAFCKANGLAEFPDTRPA